VLGAHEGCELALEGEGEWRFAFQLAAGSSPEDLLPVLSFWYVGAGRCALYSNGEISCGGGWVLAGLQQLEPIVWNITGWFQGTQSWNGPARAFAHAPRVGGQHVRPFFLDDQKAEDCDVFFAFRPESASATGDWRLEANRWLLTLPWETLYNTGCADWPPSSENLPPIEYCHAECVSVPLYSPLPTCT